MRRLARLLPLVLLLGLIPPGPAAAQFPDAEHFRCYNVEGPAPSADQGFNRVSLNDQFETQRTKVLRPVLICNPVTKCRDGHRTPDPECEEVQNLADHLVCYRTADPPPLFATGPTGLQVQVENQFELAILGVPNRANLLCVPSEKCELVNGFCSQP